MSSAYLRKIASVIVILAVSTVVAEIVYNGKESNVATFVVTETGKYTSLDPLDGDSSQNLPVARMLYATPLEINSDNTLTSRILEAFSYEQSTKTITWVVKKNVTYSDGTLITPEDIAFSVSRMAFTRPNFPLIKLISGLSEWLAKANPLQTLPSGILVSGNTISIKLASDYPHPLFRFCLELFGVIPKSCVNLKSNKIECEDIPSSGYYRKIEDSGNSVLFEKRADIDIVQGKKNYPKQIRITYSDIKSVFDNYSSLTDQTVVQSSEAKLTKEQLKTLQSNVEVSFTPAAWFTFLQINPNIPPFDRKECRTEFAKVFRNNFSIETNEVAEGSIFTKLVRGYKPLNELSEATSDVEAKECRTKFEQVSIPWGFESTTPAAFTNAIQRTAKELGIKIDGPIEFKDRKHEVETFLNNESAFIFGRTGFWAMDPTGDIQMLFTPNLHKVLKHFWKDNILQDYLRTIVQNGEVNSDAIDAVNSYLFQDGKINVYSHIRRFYASKNKELVKNLPIGITSPSPWHLFSGVE